MKNVNSLIAEGKLDEAAEILYESFIGILNTYSPNMTLTKAEYEKVMPAFVEKLMSPAPAEKEPTDEPGDDVVVNPEKGTLTVTFEGPEDDTLFSALKPNDISKEIIVGQKFSVVVPAVSGYTANKTTVSGTMTEDGVEVTVTYTKTVATDDDEEPTGEGSGVTEEPEEVDPTNQGPNTGGDSTPTSQDPTNGEGSEPSNPQ